MRADDVGPLAHSRSHRATLDVNAGRRPGCGRARRASAPAQRGSPARYLDVSVVKGPPEAASDFENVVCIRTTFSRARMPPSRVQGVERGRHRWSRMHPPLPPSCGADPSAGSLASAA